ncbi:MAG: hypothetical protein U0587_19445 [Candidatus Binatia bacterium]
MRSPSGSWSLWPTACYLLAVVVGLQMLTACTAQQQPTRTSYERQAEMEDAALWTVVGDRSDPPADGGDESAEAPPANGGTADVIGQIGVALMSVFVALGNVILPFLMLL